jgi:hypothetical protein
LWEGPKGKTAANHHLFFQLGKEESKSVPPYLQTIAVLRHHRGRYIKKLKYLKKSMQTSCQFFFLELGKNKTE